MAKAKPEEILNLTIARTNSSGQTENLQISYKPPILEKNLAFYSRLVAGFLYAYILPTLCVLLGFYVAFVRPKDFLAWMLLFMLLGFSSIGWKPARDTLVGFTTAFFSALGFVNVLFALYFPEGGLSTKDFRGQNGF